MPSPLKWVAISPLLWRIVRLLLLHRLLQHHGRVLHNNWLLAMRRCMQEDGLLSLMHLHHGSWRCHHGTWGRQRGLACNHKPQCLLLRLHMRHLRLHQLRLHLHLLRLCHMDDLELLLLLWLLHKQVLPLNLDKLGSLSLLLWRQLQELHVALAHLLLLLLRLV